MLRTKLIIGLLGLFVLHNKTMAQTLEHKIPKNAFAVATISGKSFFDLISLSQFNQSKIGQALIEKLNQRSSSTLQGVQDLGFNLNAQVYIYTTKTDSTLYYGILVPISSSIKLSQFLQTFGHPKELSNGQWLLDLDDKKQLLIWDEHALYFLRGDLQTRYFEDETVAKRYGLVNKKLSDAYNSELIEPTAPPIMDAEGEEWDATDSIGEYKDAVDSAIADIYDVAPAEDYEEADAARDSMYDAYYASVAADDSIKSKLLEQWLHQEAIKIVGSKETFDNQSFKKSYRKNALASLWIRNINELYQDFVPGIYNAYTLLLGGKAKKFDTGFESANVYLTFDKNAVTLDGAISFSDEQVKAYRNIYNRKLNRKFFKYLNDDAITYTSLAVNTENYLKELPTLMQQYYGSLLGQYNKEIDLGSSLFSLLLDEKAIGKVVKGDGLFALTAIDEREVKYTTYEYDDDYNSIEVEKTKKEHIPAFLAMFSSDDMQLFKKAIALGVSKDKITEDDGIYTIKGLTGPFAIYVLLKDGIVFFGTSQDDLRDIKHNRYKNSLSPKHKKLLSDNKFAVVFNSKRIVQAIDSLDIPASKQVLALQEKIQGLGDFYFTSKGIKGKRMQGSFRAEVPSSQQNALRYIMNLVEDMAFRP